MNYENILHGVKWLCLENYEEFDTLCDRALSRIDHQRAPLAHVDPELNEMIYEAFDEFCEDNEIDPEELDFNPEDVLFL